MIHISHVSKTFDNGHSYAIKDVSLHVEEGEILVLLGSSGSGKSTLLKMINRLISATDGQIKIAGQPIQTMDPILLKRSIGYVFQGIGLFPHLTIQENVSIALRLLGKNKKTQYKIAHQLLELVGLESKKYAQRFPKELSGGQQQRVGVARALAANQQLLLMDEPFGALDAITRYELQQEILRIKNELKKTILFVTHDIFEAFRLGDRIAVFHQGELLQVGSKEAIFHTPATPFIRHLVKNTMQQMQGLHNLINDLP